MVLLRQATTPPAVVVAQMVPEELKDRLDKASGEYTRRAMCPWDRADIAVLND